MQAFGGNCGHNIGQGVGHERVPVYIGHNVTTKVSVISEPLYVCLPGADGHGGGAGSGAATQSPQRFNGAEAEEGRPGLPTVRGSAATTLMLRNLPRWVKLERLVEELDLSGFAGLFDFLYIPAYHNSGNSKGFAFLNFHSSVMANCFVTEWKGCQRFGLRGRSKISVSEADIQGFEANVAWWEGMENERGQVLILRKRTTAASATIAERATSSRAAPGPTQEEDIAPAAPPESELPLPTFCR